MQEKPTALNESENPPSIDSLHSQIDLKEATRNSDFSKAFFNLKREQEVLSGSTQLDENALVGGAMPQNLFETHSDYSLESDSSNSEGKDEQVRCMWAFCSAEFVTTDDLIPHLSRLHLGGREKDSKCKWGYCNEYLYGTDELLRHLRGVHLGIERVKLTSLLTILPRIFLKVTLAQAGPTTFVAGPTAKEAAVPLINDKRLCDIFKRILETSRLCAWFVKNDSLKLP
ncbi:zinc-finger protein [Massospora cicadina]|nr:zinc-finger protein [Massospora cicadina]